MGERTFDLRTARALMPELRRHAAEIVAVRADLAELRAATEVGRPSRLGGLPELKGLEARLHELLSWFTEEGLQLKGVAPLLVDFPSTLGGEPVLLCWLEGETRLDWYHSPAMGFMGRRRIPDR